MAWSFLSWKFLIPEECARESKESPAPVSALGQESFLSWKGELDNPCSFLLELHPCCVQYFTDIFCTSHTYQMYILCISLVLFFAGVHAWGAAVVPQGLCCCFWMMSEQDLADVVQIAVEDLTPDNPGRRRFTADVHCKSLLSFSLKSKAGFYSKRCFWSPYPIFSIAPLVYLQTL